MFILTLKEVSERFKVAESSIKNSFPRVQKSLLKKYDIHLIKEGRGSSANYKVVEEESDFHALTMYEETKNEIILNKESVRMMNWTFSVFLGIIFTPMLVFRGSFTDFLKYIGVTPSLANINALKGALAELEENEYISYTLDKTDLNYFVAALYRKTEEEMHVGISMVRRCKQIAEIHHKKS